MNAYEDYGWEEENFANAYRNWIERQMHASQYRILFDILYDVEFEWDIDIPMDENRAKDGIGLREVFASEEGLDIPMSAKYWPCSFLEFMVALARRIDDQVMYDPESGKDASDWFWEMMDNCGLSKCDDRWMLSQDGMGSMLVYAMVNKVMHRSYSKDGNGGMFPLDDPPMDQRKEEIWYQANDYFGEKLVLECL